MTGKTPESPNLELISNARRRMNGVEVESQQQEQERLERRRKPRLTLTAEQFRMSANGKIFSVADLSHEGMAIRVLGHEDFAYFPVAMRVEGVLNLKGVKYPITLKVRHLGKELIGCEFEELSAEVKEAIRIFLDPQVLGRELRPIPSSEAGALWYHGPTGTDLLFWRSVDGSYFRFALYLHGISVYWDESEGLRTGIVQDADSLGESQGVVRFDNLVIRKDPKPENQKLDIAKALVLSSNLPEDMKKWCARHLELGS